MFSTNPDRNRDSGTGLNGETVYNAAGRFVHGLVQAGLRMNRGEGIWFAAGKMFIMDTSGGAISRGTTPPI